MMKGSRAGGLSSREMSRYPVSHIVVYIAYDHPIAADIRCKDKNECITMTRVIDMVWGFKDSELRRTRCV